MKNLKAVLLALVTLAQPVLGQEMRDYTDDLDRTVSIPVDPQRIVSLRGEQFTTPLWELGANIVGSSGRIDAGKNDGKPYPRGAYDIFGIDFENTDLAWAGDPNIFDFEAIAAIEPDLILVPDWVSQDLEKLSAIAPTVAIGIWSNPLLERYRKIADAAGVLDRYEMRLAHFEIELDDARSVVADAVGNPADVTVAVAEAFEDKLYVYRQYAALSYVINALGFSTPQIILDLEDGDEAISPEMVQQIDADFLVGTYNFAFKQSPTAQRAAWDNLIPGWRDLLHAPRHNQHIFFDREKMRGVSFAAMESTLAILLSHVATREFVPLPK